MADAQAVFPIMFIHAVGSALGELPPFLSAAHLTSYFQIDSSDGPMARLHRWTVDRIQTRQFPAIVILAAWPNATFDCAGMAAGCAGMKTSSFLLATIIGKALIRAPATCALLLSQVHYPWLRSVLQSVLPSSVSELFQHDPLGAAHHHSRQKKGDGEGAALLTLSLVWRALVLLVTLKMLWTTMAEAAKIEKDLQRQQKSKTIREE